MTKKILPNRELELLSVDEKRNYFMNLKNYCLNLKTSNIGSFNQLISPLFQYLRTYDYETIGEENIPNDGKCLLICNHSNSHDYFTSYEVFKNLGSAVSVFAGSDDLNLLTKILFKKTGATLIDRNDKDSIENGIFNFVSKVSAGIPGVIFGESTWNIHPYKLMHQIKIGASLIAAIAEVPIIPTIFEYVEVPKLCQNEKELYSKCIVSFGRPFNIDQSKSLILQTNEIQKILENYRLEIWKKLEIDKTCLEDVNRNIYLNHTYLKKFGAFGYSYDSESESRFLFSNNGQIAENEYCLNSKGEFVPGVTRKKSL